MDQGANTSVSSGSSSDESINQNGNSSITDVDASCGSLVLTNKKKVDIDKRHQYTIKQRMDMYAFCVLEMELNGNKVSIKKQQQAVQKVIQSKLEQLNQQNTNGITHSGQTSDNGQQAFGTHQQQQAISNQQPEQQPQTHHHGHDQQQQQPQQDEPEQQKQQSSGQQQQSNQPQTGLHNTGVNVRGVIILSRLQDHNYNVTQKNNTLTKRKSPDDSGRSLLDMQLELTYCNYSDFQKTQPLTTSMLREVQRRFAKYYPECPPPSRTTIKHVFEKCVKYGTVENIKNKRKATKIPQGDEITDLLLKEPQLSLRQLARRLNVSTGTVSRRCKALGLVPESVTTKHQQLAIAKRQKQMKLKEFENSLKSSPIKSIKGLNSNPSSQSASASSRATNSRQRQTNRAN